MCVCVYVCVCVCTLSSLMYCNYVAYMIQVGLIFDSNNKKLSSFSYRSEFNYSTLHTSLFLACMYATTDIVTDLKGCLSGDKV